MEDVAPPGALALHLLDVGQGEAVIIDFPDDSFGLVDAGPRSDAAVVLQFMERRRGQRFRFAAVTQWDRDHAAGMPAVLRLNKPEVLYTPGIALDLIERLAGREAAPIVEATRRECGRVVEEKRLNARDPLFTPEGVTLIALSPYGHLAEEIWGTLRPGMSADQIKRLRNRASLVLWMTFAGRTLFLGGEAESDQYDRMVELWSSRHDPLAKHGPPCADWIKLSHHGAEGNNPVRLYQCFAKHDFVASASAGARYGHPHPLTLSRLPEGGRAMCTRLGTGCALILRDALDPRRPEQWLDRYPGLSRLKNPRKACFGTVTVEITGRAAAGGGACHVRGGSVQPSCPYGGPKEGAISLPGSS